MNFNQCIFTRYSPSQKSEHKVKSPKLLTNTNFVIHHRSQSQYDGLGQRPSAIHSLSLVTDYAL